MAARAKAALIFAGVLATTALSREAGGGRRLAAALGPGDQRARSSRELRSRSAALQLHLRQNPGDVMAADLLNDTETELIRRAL